MKGRNKFWFAKDYVFIDFEPVRKNEIYVEMINSSYKANLFLSLIKPEKTAQQ